MRHFQLVLHHKLDFQEKKTNVLFNDFLCVECFICKKCDSNLDDLYLICVLQSVFLYWFSPVWCVNHSSFCLMFTFTFTSCWIAMTKFTSCYMPHLNILWTWWKLFILTNVTLSIINEYYLQIFHNIINDWMVELAQTHLRGLFLIADGTSTISMARSNLNKC
jgi:hypothetical protein